MFNIDEDVKEELDLAIDFLVIKGGSFTAYDVTREARTTCDVKFFHNEVRDYIHSELQKLVDDGALVKGQSQTHPAFEYMVIPTLPLQVTLVPPEFKIHPDARGRICIPVEMTQQAFHVVPGEVLGVCEENQTLLLGREKDLPKLPFARYTVDKDMNVRISRTVLNTAKITSQSVTACVDNNLIKVKSL